MASRTGNLFELLRDAGEGDTPKKRKEDKKSESPKPAAPKAAAKKAESPAVKPAQPKAAVSKAAAKPAAAKPAAPRPSEPKAAAGNAVSSADKKPRADRPATREGGNARPPRGEGKPQKAEGEPRRERRDREKENRGRSDVVSEEKGFVQISKRTHERRSGTGRPSNENKKGGAGKGNWGKELDNVAEGGDADQSEDVNESKTEENKEEAQPKPLTPEEEAAIKEKEKEERMVTLEEFKKKAEDDKANLPLPELRKAGEGVNQDKWSSYKKLEKNDDDGLFSVSQKGKGKATPQGAAAKKSNVIPVTDVLNVKQERKPERGPREGRRGGRGDSGKRSGGGNKAAEFKLSDQAFPALKETAKA